MPEPASHQPVQEPGLQQPSAAHERRDPPVVRNPTNGRRIGRIEGAVGSYCERANRAEAGGRAGAVGVAVRPSGQKLGAAAGRAPPNLRHVAAVVVHPREVLRPVASDGRREEEGEPFRWRDLLREGPIGGEPPDAGEPLLASRLVGEVLAPEHAVGVEVERVGQGPDDLQDLASLGLGGVVPTEILGKLVGFLRSAMVVDSAVPGDRGEPPSERLWAPQSAEPPEDAQEDVLNQIVHVASGNSCEENPVDHSGIARVEPLKRRSVSILSSLHEERVFRRERLRQRLHGTTLPDPNG